MAGWYSTFGGEISNWQDVFDNTFIIEGLSPNTYYTFGVRNLCSEGIYAGGKYISFSTGAEWCSGTVWTDTGGAESNYSGAQHVVTIIKPEINNHAVSVTFQDFWTQLQDVVYIYDGVGTQAPLLGSWSGYFPPTEPFTAVNSSGALTFEFITGQMVVPSEGWAAIVECSVMGEPDNAFTSLQYFPNPVAETLMIKTSTGLSSIDVYNMAGQSLIQKKVNTNSYSLDMSSFSAGLYIVKISNGSNVAYIKIIKE